jgi:hypothetical protein
MQSGNTYPKLRMGRNVMLTGLLSGTRRLPPSDLINEHSWNYFFRTFTAAFYIRF